MCLYFCKSFCYTKGVYKYIKLIYNNLLIKEVNKLLKKIISLILAVAFVVMLSGCNATDLSENKLLTPPKPTGELYEIQKALESSVKGSINLKYPTSGEYRSAFILKDLDNSGEEDYCIALYAVGVESSQNIHLNVIKKTDGEWKSLHDTYYASSDVEMIDFYDFTGDGILEIIVGFNVYSGVDKQIAVYSLEKNSLVSRLLEPYDHFMFTDLNANKEKELFVLNFDAATAISTAKIFTFTKNGVTEEGSCRLDGTISSYLTPVESKIANDQPAIFIDAVKGKGLITEVVFIKDGKLYAPFINETTGQNTATQRETSVSCKDINEDGKLDIPTLQQISGVTGNDVSNSYVTNWINHNGTEAFTVAYTIMNYVDGYYLTIPEDYVVNIGINRQTDARQRTFYIWNYEENLPETELFTIMVVTLEAWYKMPASSGYFELERDSGYVYLGKVETKEENEYSVTKEQLQEMFNLIKG